jgi:hypothetical protein
MNFNGALMNNLYLGITPFWTAMYKMAAGKACQSRGVNRT